MAADGGRGQAGEAGGASCGGALAEGSPHDVDVRLDATTVYWNDGTGIWRVNKAGGAKGLVASGSIDQGCFAVGSQDVYFATHGSAVVERASGGQVATLPGPVALLAIDEDTLYVIAAPAGGVEGLYTVSLSGGAPALRGPLTARATQPSSPEGVYGVVVRDQVTYVSLIGAPPHDSSIVAIDAMGQLTNLSMRSLSLPPTGLAVDDTFAYFANYIDQSIPAVWRVPTAGGDATSVASTPNYCSACAVAPVAADSRNAYFAIDEYGATLEAWPTAGGTALTVARPSLVTAAITGIASDGTCVYWVTTADPRVNAAPVP